MSKVTAGWDRFVFFLLGLIFIAFGVWPILEFFEVDFAKNIPNWLALDSWSTISEQSWWLYALIGVAAFSIIAGLWLLIANLRANRVNRLKSSASNQEGSIALNMGSISSGIAKHLETVPGVTGVQRKVSEDRGRRTTVFTITAAPETPLEQLRSAAEESEADFREAFPDTEMDTVYKLHYDKVSS